MGLGFSLVVAKAYDYKFSFRRVEAEEI